MVNMIFVMSLFNMLHNVSTSVSVPDSSLMRCDKEWGYAPSHLHLCCTRGREIPQRAPVLPFHFNIRQTFPFALNEPCYGNSAAVKLLTPRRIHAILSMRL